MVKNLRNETDERISLSKQQQRRPQTATQHKTFQKRIQTSYLINAGKINAKLKTATQKTSVLLFTIDFATDRSRRGVRCEHCRQRESTKNDLP